MNKKRWNTSTNPFHFNKSELHKVIFEVRHGLKDSKIEKLKNKKHVELGTDTRNLGDPNWKLPPLLSTGEKKEIIKYM